MGRKQINQHRTAMPYPAYAYLISGLVLLNVITFFVYGMDKRAARDGTMWRVPEATLLMLALFGGSPAAYFARRYFRHKTSKGPFVVRFWLVILLQLLGIAVLAAAFFL